MEQHYLDLLRADEGIRLVVYDDATGTPIGPGTVVQGHPTIGIGRALDVHGLSASEVEILFANDVGCTEAKLNSTIDFYHTLTPGRKFVLLSLAFNLGWHGLLGFPRMLAAMRRADWVTAKAELLNSRAAHQLPARYQRLADILLSGA